MMNCWSTRHFQPETNRLKSSATLIRFSMGMALAGWMILMDGRTFGHLALSVWTTLLHDQRGSIYGANMEPFLDFYGAIIGLTRAKSVNLWSFLKLLMFAVFTYKYQSIYQQLFSLSMFLGFLMGTFLLELKLNHCLLLLFESCCTRSYHIFWKNMEFLKKLCSKYGANC